MSPLLIKAILGIGLVFSLTTWGLLERGEKLVAEGNMKLAQAETEQWKAATEAMGKQIKDCNAAVDNWSQAAKDAQKDALEARQKAQAESAKHAGERASLKAALARPTPVKAGCDTAWNLIEGRIGKR